MFRFIFSKGSQFLLIPKGFYLREALWVDGGRVPVIFFLLQ